MGNSVNYSFVNTWIGATVMCYKRNNSVNSVPAGVSSSHGSTYNQGTSSFSLGSSSILFVTLNLFQGLKRPYAVRSRTRFGMTYEANLVPRVSNI